MLALLLVSFLAGVLTVFAPCVFTLLPVILGSSLTEKSWRKPVVIILSLLVSVILFTLILKVSTSLIVIPYKFWTTLSGGIVLAYSLTLLFPKAWGILSYKITGSPERVLDRASQRSDTIGDILVGMALGPVFSSCSPTYALLIVTIFPVSFRLGVLGLISYSVGLGMVLSAIVVLGQGAISKLKWAVNPNGLFKKSLGLLLLVVGFAILLGLDKSFETYLVQGGFYTIADVEINLLKRFGFH